MNWAALAQMLAEGQQAYHYRLFLTPLPVWDFWYLLLLPLAAAVAVVYKSIKCHTMRQVPREAAEVFVMILAFIVVIGAVLQGIVWLAGR